MLEVSDTNGLATRTLVTRESTTTIVEISDWSDLSKGQISCQVAPC